MRKSSLELMKGGWFIGSFQPSLCYNPDVEVGVKYYQKGEYSPAHFHQYSTEYTVIAKGKVQMLGINYNEGDIIIIEPNEVTDFFAITDAVTVVVKIPSVLNDKIVL